MQSSSPSAPQRRRSPYPRRRGAQPGNTNALKHGFYSPRAVAVWNDLHSLVSLPDAPIEPTPDFPGSGLPAAPVEPPANFFSSGPAASPEAPLESEIQMLRDATARVAKLGQDDRLDLDRLMALVNTLGAASIRIGTLIRTQKILAGNRNEVADLLQQAISEVLQETPTTIPDLDRDTEQDP